MAWSGQLWEEDGLEWRKGGWPGMTRDLLLDLYVAVRQVESRRAHPWSRRLSELPH